MHSKKILITILIFFSVATLAMPYFVSAAAPIKSNVFDLNTLSGPLLICEGNLYITGPDGKTQIPNPKACTNLCDLVAQIANIIYFVIAVVIWIVAPITIAIAGIRLMASGSNPAEPTKENPGEISKAKKMITGVVVGIVIVLCSWLIVKTFVSALGISGIGGFSDNTPVCKL